MSGIFDKEKIDFICPNCNKKVVMTISELRQPSRKCPHCSLKIENNQFRRELQKVDKQIKDFKHSLENLKFNINL